VDAVGRRDSRSSTTSQTSTDPFSHPAISRRPSAASATERTAEAVTTSPAGRARGEVPQLDPGVTRDRQPSRAVHRQQIRTLRRSNRYRRRHRRPVTRTVQAPGMHLAVRVGGGCR
jgi:hypothetical protein